MIVVDNQVDYAPDRKAASKIIEASATEAPILLVSKLSATNGEV